MPELMVRGIRIHYLESRAKKAGKKTPVLFIHGSGGNAGPWNKVMAGLAGEYTSWAIDLPGHGASEGEGLKTVRDYSLFIRDFLEALGTESAVIGGHSMGGAIAQDFSLVFPEKTKALLLIGTGARLRVLPEILELHRKAAMGEAEPKFFPYAFYEKTPPEIIAEGEKEWAKTGPKARYFDFLACDQFDILKEVDRIRLPSLIVCGKEDRMTPVKYSEFLNKKMTGSRMEVIERAGHMLMLEAPQALTVVILSFLASL